MVKKLLLLTFSYLLLAFALIALDSCRPREALICDLFLVPGYSYSTGDPLHGIEDGFIFDTRQCPITSLMQDINLINSSYATTVCYEYKNELLTSGFKLSLSRPIYLNGDTIAENTDLFSIPNIHDKTTIEIIDDCKSLMGEIKFKPELIGLLDFETGEYEATLEASTNDGQHFSPSCTIIFKP